MSWPDTTGSDFELADDCDLCFGTGCPCTQWRDWFGMDDCECGCIQCGLTPLRVERIPDPPIPRPELLPPSAARAGRLAAMPYKEYLRSLEWKERARQEKDRQRCCQRCGESYHRFLHVHHVTYERRGNEADGDLEVLCFRCHRAEHGIRR